jgi:hypothetical protein
VRWATIIDDVMSLPERLPGIYRRRPPEQIRFSFASEGMRKASQGGEAHPWNRPKNRV